MNFELKTMKYVYIRMNISMHSVVIITVFVPVRACARFIIVEASSIVTIQVHLVRDAAIVFSCFVFHVQSLYEQKVRIVMMHGEQK